MNRHKIILLDTHAILHRFYHALPKMENSAGVPTQAVYGLTNILLKIIDEYKPIKLFACFDRSEPTKREILFKEYKSHRPETKDDLKIQISLAKKLIEKFNIPIFERPGYEAEDLIGSIVEKIKNKADGQIVIVTGDLDTLQLVEGEKVVVCILKKGLSETDVYNEKKVIERFGFIPPLLPDYKALVGDQSDNIKGIAGIGTKRGSELVKKFGSIENIIEKSEYFKEAKIKKGISESKELLVLNKNLTTINRDLEVNLPQENYQGVDKEKILPFLKELNFKSIAERLNKQITNVLQLTSAVSEEINFSVNQDEFENSLLANSAVVVFVLQEENLFAKTDLLRSSQSKASKFYQLRAAAEIFKKILNCSLVKITFDFKEFLKVIFENNPAFEFNRDNITDIKIAFSLVHSDVSAKDLNKIINFCAGKIYSSNEGISQFLQFGQKTVAELERKIKEMDLSNTYALEKKLIPVLARMETNGLFFDVEAVEQFKNFLASKLKNLKTEIVNLAGVDFNVNSTKSLQEVLFAKLKISSQDVKKTPKGAISTSESELLKIKNAHPVIEKILEYREFNKVITTYTDSLIKAINPTTNRLHTHFEQLGAATGRITSINPNLQNIPVKGVLAQELRKCFKPQLGFSFVGLDYAQMELRLASHLSHDENLTLAFQGNIDVHSLTSRLLFKKSDEKSRRLAKAVNFGIIYGMSAHGLKERLGISRDEAQKIIDNYFLNFPGLKKMRDNFVASARMKGYAETLSGRKRIIQEINSGAFRERMYGERMAINMPIQGLAADIIKKSLIEIDEFLLVHKFYPKQARIVLQLYDSIIIEAKDDILNQIKNEAKKIMENIIALNVPLKINVKIGKDLSKI
jgi:DNA polymerase-1